MTILYKVKLEKMLDYRDVRLYRGSLPSMRRKLLHWSHCAEISYSTVLERLDLSVT